MIVQKLKMIMMMGDGDDGEDRYFGKL